MAYIVVSVIALVVLAACAQTANPPARYVLGNYVKHRQHPTEVSDDSFILFPGQNTGPLYSYYNNTPSAGKQEVNVKSAKQIPLDLLKRLGSIEDVSEFTNFLKGFTDVGTRFGETEEDIKHAETPKQASCKPELQTVSLRVNDDPTKFYFPTCTRVERCGGCCAHKLFSCQPTKSETVNFQVMVSQYEGGSQLTYKGKQIVSVEQHTKCKCDCIIKKSDCNQLQEYRNNECRCVCMNVDQQRKCSAENDTKIWDPKECTCSCREIQECTTSYYFDPNICSCVPIQKEERSIIN